MLTRSSHDLQAPQTQPNPASRLLGTVLDFILSPLQHFFHLGQRLFQIRKLTRLVS